MTSEEEARKLGIEAETEEKEKKKKEEKKGAEKQRKK